MIDDEELKKLFEDSGDGQEENNCPSDDAPSKAPSSPKKAAAKNESINLKKIISNLKRKIRKAAEKRKERRSDIPLKDREYLPDFPINFRGVLMIFLILSVLVLVLSIIFLPAYRVQTIRVEGNIALSDDRIINESGIRYGDHLFSGVSGNPLEWVRLDYGKTERKMLEKDPHIKEIRITVNFPSTIVIYVEERNKVAYIKMPDGYAAIDDEGTVIELVTSPEDTDNHAVICGLDVYGAALGEKIVIRDDTDYRKALVVLGSIINADLSGVKGEYMLFENIKEIRVIPGGNIFLTVVTPSGSELQVKLASLDNITEDMSWLRYAVLKGAFEGLPDGALDMTGEEKIYRRYD